MKSYIRTIDTAYALFMVLYPSQTTILEGWTEDEIRISEEALFKGVSTQSGLHLLIILPKASFREHIFVTIITRDSRWRHEEDIWGWYDARYKYHLENFMLPQKRFGQVEPTFPERVFEARFKGVSTLFGLRGVEKCFENTFRTVC
jgi:hypothetical protein